MTMLTNIRQYFFLQNLRRLLAKPQRTRRAHTLETARTIGLLFDATTDKTRREVLGYAQILEKKGKKVRLLGYFDTPQPPAPTPDFAFFFKKETAWTGLPRSEKAAQFAQEKLDLLLALNPDDLPPLTWLAAQSAAAMKVGYATEQPHDLDVQVETPPEKGIRHFAEQLELYLGKIRAA
jgi:hypothetical protein